MPRKAPPKGPGARSDGEVTGGNLKTTGAGQPNGAQRAAVTQVLARAGAGSTAPYGEGGALASDASQTDLPPNVTPMGDSVRQQMAAHYAQHKPTPLFSPTQRPFEHVTAGAPLSPGPTNPMAAAAATGAQATSVATILQQAAQSSGSPTLQALADRAAATAAGGSGISSAPPGQ